MEEVKKSLQRLTDHLQGLLWHLQNAQDGPVTNISVKLAFETCKDTVAEFLILQKNVNDLSRHLEVTDHHVRVDVAPTETVTVQGVDKSTRTPRVTDDEGHP